MPVRSPEAELLLCCVQLGDSPQRTGHVNALIEEGVDWGVLLRAASGHGMLPLLYWQLDGIQSADIPPEVLNWLRGHFHANRLRSLFLTGELLKLLSELEAHDIPALPYKGPVLAASAYGDLALREFGDLDVLVRKEDVLRAREVVASLGYQPQHQVGGNQEAAFLRYERQYPFVRGDGSMVELHWRVVPRSLSFLLGSENFWERAIRVPLGGSRVSTFATEDALLILCLHGCAHFWERLGWIRDIATLIDASKSLDWERLMDRAEALNIKRMLLLSLFLAHDLMGMNLPESIVREIGNDRVVKASATRVSENLFSENSVELSGGAARGRFHLQMMERLRDKLQYCFHRTTTPTSADWELTPLPAALSPFYRLLRVLRLGGESGRRLIGRIQ